MRRVESAPVAMVVLFCLALIDRVVLVWFTHLDGLYGQDAYAYYGYARMLQDALTHVQLPPPFWWPLGYPIWLNVSFLFGASIQSAQIITLLSGALVAPFAYGLAYEAASGTSKNVARYQTNNDALSLRGTHCAMRFTSSPQSPRSAYHYPPHKVVAGWTAGLLCAACGQLAQSSIVIMADVPALMFAALGSWLLLLYARRRNLFILGIASVSVSMAVWTRWQNLIFASVWLATVLVVEWKTGCEHRQAGILRFLFGLGIMALVLLPQFLLGSTTNAPLAGQSWLEGWSVGNFGARSFDNVDGHFSYALPVALFYAQVFAHPAYLFALVTPFFAIGIWVLSKPFGAATVLLLGWILGMFLFLAGIPYENFRFSLGLFAPVAVVTGIGACGLLNRWRTVPVRLALAACIGVALLVMLYWQPRVLAPVLEIKARELGQAEWLTSRVPNDATLWTMGVDGALETYTTLHVANLWGKSAEELRATTPAYLFIDTANFESQWNGKQPQLLYHALRDENDLQELAQIDGWTLFKISGK